jgi:hypothetical protein
MRLTRLTLRETMILVAIPVFVICAMQETWNRCEWWWHGQMEQSERDKAERADRAAAARVEAGDIAAAAIFAKDAAQARDRAEYHARVKRRRGRPWYRLLGNREGAER